GRAAERRQVTIMVCGLAEIAALSANLDPEEMRELVDKYCREVGEVVERHGGYVASRTNEGIVSYFGYPQANEDDAERAVRAGLAAAQISGVSASRPVPGPVRGRVGIATGLVLVGRSNGSGSAAEQAEHLVSGETPYAAAILQSRGEAGQVVISVG